MVTRRSTQKPRNAQNNQVFVVLVSGGNIAPSTERSAELREMLEALFSSR
jgi:hypothetical protein